MKPENHTRPGSKTRMRRAHTTVQIKGEVMRARTRRWLTAGAASVMLGAMTLVLPVVVPGLGASALADVPSVPATEPFTAPRCAGTTNTDPSTVMVGENNLTDVWGQRLVEYNAGNPVVLYDGSGGNGEPTTCVLTYVEGVGPVADWSFCTDAYSAPCTTTGEDGSLVGNGLRPLPGNPRITADQERIIGYLVKNGWEVRQGIVPNNTQAHANLGSNHRVELQYLIWCISDPTYDPTYCSVNMTAADQQTILNRVPVEGDLSLNLAGPGVAALPGASVTVELSTNVFDQPIELGVTGGEVVVCGDTSLATLSGGTLVVHGADSAVSVDVELCVTRATVGTVNLDLSVTAALPQNISWMQVDTDELVDGKPCQVFSLFDSERAVALVDSAKISFDAPVTESPTTEAPTTEAPTTEAPTTSTSTATTSTATSATAVSTTAGSSTAPSASAGKSDTLANTGANLTPLVSAAAAVALGGLLLMVRRRRELDRN